MKTTRLSILLLTLAVSANCALAQNMVATNGATSGSSLRRVGGQPDALAASRQTMQQAEAAYNTALAAAAPDLPALDAQIAQARDALMALQMQRQRMVRTAERSIADVANALDTARDTYMQASRAQMTTRQAALAAQRAAVPQP